MNVRGAGGARGGSETGDGDGDGIGKSEKYEGGGEMGSTYEQWVMKL